MLAIVAAMHEELSALLEALDPVPEPAPAQGAVPDPLPDLPGRVHRGRLGGHDVVLTLSGIGKVAAATTATRLLERYDLHAVLLVGTAGALAPGVRVGDVVVADQLLQHDLDATPLFPRWEVPLTGRSRFATDPGLASALAAAARSVLAQGEPGPRVHRGLVVSGDTFVADSAAARRLQADLPDALAVEMEGAAVAQVCTDYRVPFAVVRWVSDRADEAAERDFAWFVREVAARHAHDVVRVALAGPALGTATPGPAARDGGTTDPAAPAERSVREGVLTVTSGAERLTTTRHRVSSWRDVRAQVRALGETPAVLELSDDGGTVLHLELAGDRAHLSAWAGDVCSYLCARSPAGPSQPSDDAYVDLGWNAVPSWAVVHREHALRVAAVVVDDRQLVPWALWRGRTIEL